MIDKKEIQEAFQDLRFGMFIHFGLYSQGKEHEWHQHRHKLAHSKYRDEFLESFDPDPKGIEQWVITAKKMGAKYIVVTSKHHDGFCLWDSKIKHLVDPTYHIRSTTFWKKNQKSILDILFEAGKKHGIRIGLYYSVIDWSWTEGEQSRRRSPHHLNLKKKNRPLHQQYLDYYKAQLLELGTLYPENLLYWFDGYQFHHRKYPNGFLHYLDAADVYNQLTSTYPKMLVGNNSGTTNTQRDMGSTDFLLFENSAGRGEQKGAPWPRNSNLPGEVCLTINKAWGYAENDKAYKKPEDISSLVLNNALKNANTLLNFGPMPNGFIAKEQLVIAEKIGQLLLPYSDFIYGTRNQEVKPWGGISISPSTKYQYILINQPGENYKIKTENPENVEWVVGSGNTSQDGDYLIANTQSKSALIKISR